MNTEKTMSTTSPERRPRILMLPWLAHGHVSPFLELSKRLLRSNFHIYFCSTPVCLEPIRDSLGNSTSAIQPIEINLPCSDFPELPPHYHTTKDLPPNLMPTLKAAFDASKPRFADILESLKPDLLIYDYLQPWAASAASEANINAVLFLTPGGATTSFVTFCIDKSSTEYPFPALNMPESESAKITQFMDYVANGLKNGERHMESVKGSSKIVLSKTSRVIEQKYVDHLSEITNKEVITVGPLLQEHNLRTGADENRVIMDWLSEKEEASVVFVSFGTEYFLSKDEREEIAHGLELSGVGFIWVVRFHGAERKEFSSLHDALPDGFLERIGDRGMVVENWAPQCEILGSSSVGGFVSHCGWSSTLEGIMFGVPIVAMPMHLDQPLNAKVVVDIGVGIEVRKGSNGGYEREEIAKAVREVVVMDRGKEIRRNVKELSRRMKEEEDREMEVVIEKLIQLM